MELLTPVEVFRSPKHVEGPVVAGSADPAYRAYELLYVGFIAAPLAAGLDKYFNLLCDWSKYLAPVVSRHVAAGTFMRGIGIVEIAAAALVAVNPRIGGIVVAAWLWGIITNLLLVPGYFDVALRDFGLSLGALALSLLAREYGRRAPPLP